MNEYICKICKKILTCQFIFKKHISHEHMPFLAYLCECENKKEFSKKNLCNLYFNEKKSTPMIGKLLNTNKTLLLKLFKYYKIKPRNISEAAKNQIARDGLWNKGKTKYDHPSIMKSANNRRGKNNPFYTAPNFVERYEKMLKNFAIVRKKCFNTRIAKTTELRLSKILTKNKIHYVRNFSIKFTDKDGHLRWRLYDFLISNKLIVETHGNYWHANPKNYKKDDKIGIKGFRTANEIWEYDKNKKNIAYDYGYDYLVLWEDDMCSMMDDEIFLIIKKLLLKNNGDKNEK